MGSAGHRFYPPTPEAHQELSVVDLLTARWSDSDVEPHEAVMMVSSVVMALCAVVGMVVAVRNTRFDNDPLKKMLVSL